MAVNYNRIRVGAPDSMLLDQGTSTQVDLGASLGGATFSYNATYLSVEIDQAIMAVNAYKTKEEILFSVVLGQEQSSILLAALSLGTDLLTTTVAGTLTTPTAPSVTPQGTAGTTSYSYEVVAFDGNGDGLPSPAGTTALGNTTLSTVNSNLVTWTAVPGALGYKILRTAGGASTGLVGTVMSGGTLQFSDTGIAATAYTNSASNPALPNTDQITFGGRLAVPFHTFDWSVPKNDGTANHWRGHFFRTYSARQVAIDYKRDKVTEVNKCELLALADTTRPVGQQGGYLIEES